jgi:hypothetical protein
LDGQELRFENQLRRWHWKPGLNCHLWKDVIQLFLLTGLLSLSGFQHELWGFWAAFAVRKENIPFLSFTS